MTKSINSKERSVSIIQSMVDDFEFKGNRVALIGNRGHQNFGDELILIGNIKLIKHIILKQGSVTEDRSDYYILPKGRELITYSANITRLQDFHRYFNLSNLNIKYLQELPHGFRSFMRYIRLFSNIKNIKYRFTTDTYILGGGEIFTPETPFSYQYWTISLIPYFIGRVFGWMWGYRPKLIVMGGIQKPIKWIDRICFGLIGRCADRFYLRDKESVSVVKNYWSNKQASVFIDSSYFAVSDICKKDLDEKIAIFNTNPLSDNFNTMVYKIVEYSGRGYKVYFLPAYFTTHGAQDDLSVYDKICVALGHTNIDLQLLDWRKRDDFVDIFVKADFVYASRLHIYIVARLIGLDVEPFKYQKKLQKMIDIMDSIGL